MLPTAILYVFPLVVDSCTRDWSVYSRSSWIFDRNQYVFDYFWVLYKEKAAVIRTELLKPQMTLMVGVQEGKDHARWRSLCIQRLLGEVLPESDVIQWAASSSCFLWPRVMFWTCSVQMITLSVFTRVPCWTGVQKPRWNFLLQSSITGLCSFVSALSGFHLGPFISRNINVTPETEAPPAVALKPDVNVKHWCSGVRKRTRPWCAAEQNKELCHMTL